MRFFKTFSVFFNTCVTKVSAFFVVPQQIVTSLLMPQHLEVAKLCRDVYSDDIEDEKFIESSDTGAQATVTLDGTRAIVCCRGSNSITDWGSNFRLSRVPFISRMHSNPDLEVHCGFFAAHNSVKAKIYAKLNAIVESGKCDSILFAGHSAGATLAAISAFDFQNDKNLELEVVSLGSPKIGNAAFAAEFNSKIKCTRIVNDNDGIANSPLLRHVPFFRGYRHVGRDVIKLRNMVPEEGQTYWNKLVNFARLDSVADHDIDNYIANMEQSLKKKIE